MTILDEKLRTLFENTTNHTPTIPYHRQNNLPLRLRRSYSTPAKAESEVKTTKNQDLPVTDENQLSTEKDPGIY